MMAMNESMDSRFSMKRLARIRDDKKTEKRSKMDEVAQ